MANDITWDDTFRTRVRLLAGIESEEIDNGTLDTLANIASEWFDENTGTSFTLGSDNTHDNAVMYYTCYLASIAQNGVGIDRIAVGDLQVYYDSKEYIHFEEMANQYLMMKLSLSIKRTVYNASPNIGPVKWKKNVRGDESTLVMYPKPRGIQYGL
jgi:hypothetical protein